MQPPTNRANGQAQSGRLLQRLGHGLGLVVFQSPVYAGGAHVGGGNEKENLTVTELILHCLGKHKSLIRFVTDRPGHVDGMPSIAADFVVLAGSRRFLLKKGFVRQWSGIARTRVGGRRSSPGRFAPITNKCMADVCKKDGRADSDCWGKRSVWLRSPAHSCVARLRNNFDYSRSNLIPST